MADFTIVTPVLNQASTIEACIRSVANQMVNVEHIVIDGGSSDGTVEIIRKNEHLLTHWISESDSGQSEAINKGLAMATGTFFNWLNADDQLTENALKTVLLASESRPDVIVGKCQHLDENGIELNAGSARVWPTLEATLGNYSMGQPSVFYRTSVVRSLGGLNEQLHLCMDMDLWFRYLLMKGQSEIETTSEILSRFFVRNESKSIRMKEAMNAEKYGLCHALFTNFQLPLVLDDFFANYPVPADVNYSLSTKLNPTILFANFCWHLMVKAYENKDFGSCKEWFDVVRNGSRLSDSEKLIWMARITSGKLSKS